MYFKLMSTHSWSKYQFILSLVSVATPGQIVQTDIKNTNFSYSAEDMFRRQIIRSSNAARSVNPRSTNLILYGANGNTGTRPWKNKVF